MFCGTLAAHGGVRAADIFEFELEDPVLAPEDLASLPHPDAAGAWLRMKETTSCR